MNYRHAYHAGNFSDVFKHAVLALVVEHLKAKATPFAAIDTHAGIGRYDLTSEAATKTGEWLDGIGRLIGRDDVPAALRPYLDAVARQNGGRLPKAVAGLRHYPGSPAIVAHLMRRDDRLRAAELHPEDARTLERAFAADRRVTVERLDGYTALKAWLPPKERRGLVLVDPPFERTDEFDAMLRGLIAGHRRFQTGVFMLWYPIKDPAPVAAFHRGLIASGIRRILIAELKVFAADAPDRLNGSGLAIVNPPWRIDGAITNVTDWLVPILARDPGATANVEWLVCE